MYASTIRKPQFDLSNADLVPIVASYIASGDWSPLSESEGKEFLLKFVQNLKERGFDAVRWIFVSAQNNLMAVGRKSFVDIQKLAAFSQFGLKNMAQLDAEWQSDGNNGFEDEWTRIFAPGWRAGVLPNQIIRLSGGSGDCEDNAIRVHAPDVEARIIAEYWYLHYVYGRRDVDWKYSSQHLTPRDEQGREFDVLTVELLGGEVEETFFVRFPQYNHA